MVEFYRQDIQIITMDRFRIDSQLCSGQNGEHRALCRVCPSVVPLDRANVEVQQSLSGSSNCHFLRNDSAEVQKMGATNHGVARTGRLCLGNVRSSRCIRVFRISPLIRRRDALRYPTVWNRTSKCLQRRTWFLIFN